MTWLARNRSFVHRVANKDLSNAKKCATIAQKNIRSYVQQHKQERSSAIPEKDNQADDVAPSQWFPRATFARYDSTEKTGFLTN